MGSFERFKTKTHFNSLKRLVGVTALAALAGLGLVTWVVLGSWLMLGWRTVAVEAAGAVDTPAHPRPDAGSAPPGEPASPSRRSVSVPN